MEAFSEAHEICSKFNLLTNHPRTISVVFLQISHLPYTLGGGIFRIMEKTCQYFSIFHSLRRDLWGHLCSTVRACENFPTALFNCV